MKIKSIKRGTLALALSATFVLPQVPTLVFAQSAKPATFPVDLFPEDDAGDTGLKPTSPVIPSTGGNNSSGGNKANGNRPTSTRPQNGTKMQQAQVPEAYSCPLFDNRPHAELIKAIDSLSKEVKASPECNGTPSAKALEENGNAIKDNIEKLQGFLNSTSETAITSGQIDQPIAAALQAAAGLGDIFNNNNFLNSKCGRQTMSTGKVLLAMNDILNGMAPYALLAVTMNPALSAAWPFVVGGTIATSGISAINKMIDQNTLDMSNPDHRKALLQNTCQFTKVAKKVRFMQLAQSGKIDKITQELEKSIDLYRTSFANPSRELQSLLSYKDTMGKAIQALDMQLQNDRADMTTIETQIAQNNDDLMICTLSNELVNWAQDGKSFPASAFANLEAATAQGDRTQKLQSLTLRNLHLSSMKRISDYAPKAFESETALKACAQAGRSWFAGIRQAVNSTSNIIGVTKISVESELSRNSEYRQWKVQYERIASEQLTIKRVEKAMQELAKDNSIIDRSELAQRMVNLKSGLFGTRTGFAFGKPPVLAWIDHTKKMHDQAISAMVIDMRQLREGAFSLTETGRAQVVKTGYLDTKRQIDNLRTADILGSLNLKELPLGSREHEIACQQLESAWLDWSAAIDHLGAIQFFCDMVDPVLDAKMDASVISACRGYVKLNGVTNRPSVVASAREVLVRKGFRADAKLVSERMKALQCPMPAVSVMNQ